MIHFRTPFVSTAGLMGLLIAAAMVLAPHDAFAQRANGIFDMSQNVGKQFVIIPKFFANISYVLGAFFAATGLVKLKNWINEGDKAGFTPALIRLFVATLLIMLPHMILIVTQSMYPAGDGTPNIDFKTKAGNLGAFKRGTN